MTGVVESLPIAMAVKALPVDAALVAVLVATHRHSRWRMSDMARRSTGVGATLVLSVGHGLKVRRVDAAPVEAEMVNREACLNLPDKPRVYAPVRVMAGENPVAFVVEGALPFPAIRANVDTREEMRETRAVECRWKEMSHLDPRRRAARGSAMTGPVRALGYTLRRLGAGELKFGRGDSQCCGQPCFDVVGRLAPADFDAGDHRLVDARLGRQFILGQLSLLPGVTQQELRHTTRRIVI